MELIFFKMIPADRAPKFLCRHHWRRREFERHL